MKTSLCWILCLWLYAFVCNLTILTFSNAMDQYLLGSLWIEIPWGGGAGEAGGCLSSSEDEAQIWGWSPGLGSLFVCSFIPYCWKINISLPSSLNLPLIIIFKSYSPSSNHMIQNRNLQQRYYLPYQWDW